MVGGRIRVQEASSPASLHSQQPNVTVKLSPLHVSFENDAKLNSSIFTNVLHFKFTWSLSYFNPLTFFFFKFEDKGRGGRAWEERNPPNTLNNKSLRLSFPFATDRLLVNFLQSSNILELLLLRNKMPSNHTTTFSTHKPSSSKQV